MSSLELFKLHITQKKLCNMNFFYLQFPRLLKRQTAKSAIKSEDSHPSKLKFTENLVNFRRIFWERQIKDFYDGEMKFGKKGKGNGSRFQTSRNIRGNLVQINSLRSFITLYYGDDNCLCLPSGGLYFFNDFIWLYKYALVWLFLTRLSCVKDVNKQCTYLLGDNKKRAF